MVRKIQHLTPIRVRTGNEGYVLIEEQHQFVALHDLALTLVAHVVDETFHLFRCTHRTIQAANNIADHV